MTWYVPLLSTDIVSTNTAFISIYVRVQTYMYVYKYI